MLHLLLSFEIRSDSLSFTLSLKLEALQNVRQIDLKFDNLEFIERAPLCPWPTVRRYK